MDVVSKPLVEEARSYAFAYLNAHLKPEYTYHTEEHLGDVLEALEEITNRQEVAAHEKELLLLAACFHDLGYADGPKEHEERGAAMAREWLRGRGLNETDLDTVEQLILATRFPQHPKSLLEEILCDADLSHLGNAAYWDRCAKVRQEMLLAQKVVMDEHEWIEFEIEFMERHRYHTQAARDLYEKRKKKHLRQLKKRKLRLNPDFMDLMEDLEGGSKNKKKKKKKKKNQLEIGGDTELKEIDLGRGVETMFRTTYRTHVNLSSIADNKANIMLSINAIIISIVVANLVPQFGLNPALILPTSFLLLVCLAALVLAILATRPKVTQGRFTREDIQQKRANLLFFGNFFRMEIDDFHWGMMEMIKDSDFLYSSMTRDIYYLGVVLAKKYLYLRWCYAIFMYGLIASVVIFAVTFATGSGTAG